MNMSRFNKIMILGVITSTLALLQGCGSKNRLETAPDGSTITFNPTSWTINIPTPPPVGDTCVNYNIIVRYPDTTPIPKVVVTISGLYAEPSTLASYQFYSAPDCNYPGAAGVTVNSGFQAQTDVKGEYTFSALIPAVIGSPTPTTNVFTDTIVARSGTAIGTSDLKQTKQ